MSYSGGAGFESLKVSWRAVEPWQHEKPRGAIGENSVSVAAEGPGLEGSYREAEALHHEKSLVTRGYWWKCSPVVAEDLGFWRCQYRGMATKNCMQHWWNGASQSLEDKLCVPWKEFQKSAKALEGAQKIMRELQILDIELFTLL